MKVAIAFWGTGKYLNFLYNWYESLEEKFLPGVEKHYFVFTDGEIEDTPDNLTLVSIPDYGFPKTFNMTFEVLGGLRDKVTDFDWFLSVDADMIASQTITYDEFFDEEKSYIGVHHPCHFLKMSGHAEAPGSFDVSDDSNASVKDILDMSVYYQGCLWGGKVDKVFDMMSTIDEWTKDDVSRGVRAKWYEESYLNKWFTLNREDTHTLTPSYAFPEMFGHLCEFENKLTHVHKKNTDFGNTEW